MNALYNLIVGNRKNASKFYEAGEAVVETARDELDENDFVMVNSENCRQQARFVQNEDLQNHVLEQQSETDSKCVTGDTASSCQPSHSATSCLSAVADIPMQTSVLLTTIESYTTLSINHRKYLDLELFNYDFKKEISVLNADTGVSYEKRKS